ncbi:MAG: ASCH domain-containing protein [Bacillati bacterium ANGP1]|uniref:ASCH domain-containing protein n=1 Tax=Candidatus Segetimicrobium genomatis TaxID=2569760 RepID=A0A537JBM1_9BACT|nr:MAG: ASCH domain-containing protein [Terrabacteria group bacterium ANGP1]
MYALNFYSSVFTQALRDGRKTLTIRLGDKRDKYQEGQLVWVTVGNRFSVKQRIFTAVIDQVEVKTLREVTPREIERENPATREHAELIDFLSKIYRRTVMADDAVTVIHFSRVTEAKNE